MKRFIGVVAILSMTLLGAQDYSKTSTDDLIKMLDSDKVEKEKKKELDRTVLDELAKRVEKMSVKEASDKGLLWVMMHKDRMDNPGKKGKKRGFGKHGRHGDCCENNMPNMDMEKPLPPK